METVWIIGAGRFGSMAATRLSTQHKNWQFVLVDPVKENLARVKGLRIETVHADGVQFLSDRLRPGGAVSWIIPCLPVHLAWEWCRIKTGPDRLVRTPLPLGMDPFLPHPIHGENGDLYVSHADFICPDTCSEPEDLCTMTKKPRKQDMFRRLEALAYEAYTPVVLRSLQLGPGIGGYRPDHLFSFLGKVEMLCKRSLLLCTACRCHGVITGAALL